MQAQPYFPTFTAAPELQIKILNLRGKIVQNVKFSLLVNSNLNSKLDSTHQNESRDTLGFQIEPREQINRICTQNGVALLTSKNEFFNCSSFGNSEIFIGFMASKQVRD